MEFSQQRLLIAAQGFLKDRLVGGGELLGTVGELGPLLSRDPRGRGLAAGVKGPQGLAAGARSQAAARAPQTLAVWLNVYECS